MTSGSAIRRISFALIAGLCGGIAYWIVVGTCALGFVLLLWQYVAAFDVRLLHESTA